MDEELLDTDTNPNHLAPEDHLDVRQHQLSPFAPDMNRAHSATDMSSNTFRYIDYLTLRRQLLLLLLPILFRL